MGFCTNCGYPIKDGTIYCATCGAPATQPAPPLHTPGFPAPKKKNKLLIPIIAGAAAIVIVFAVLLLATDVFTGGNKSESARTVTITPGELVNVLDVGDTARISVVQNDTTGYIWTFTFSVDGILEIVSDEYVMDPRDAQAAGAGGMRVITMVAAAPGQVTIDAVLARDDYVSVTDSYRVSVGDSSAWQEVTFGPQIIIDDIHYDAKEDFRRKANFGVARGVWGVGWNPTLGDAVLIAAAQVNE